MKRAILTLILALGLTACRTAAASETNTRTFGAPAPPSFDLAPTTSPLATLTPTADPFVIFTVTPLQTATSMPTVIPADVRVAASDGMPQVFVAEGTVQMGGLDVNAENDELPEHDVHVQAFWIDQLEVTNGMYNLCVQAGVCRPPLKFSSQKRPSYFDNPEYRDHPVIQITWLDAQAYCEWAGRRLPTEAEWERAARGDDTRTYPWGDEPPSERYANFDNLIRDTSRVGSYAAGASPFGALDMAGNVWEWTVDIYDFDFYLKSPENDPVAEPDSSGRYQRVIRGGSFQDVWLDLRVSNRGHELGPNSTAAYQSVEYFGRSSAKIGFRCASDP